MTVVSKSEQEQFGADGRSLRKPICGIAVGLAVLAGLWFYNRRLDLRPVYLPLPTTGATAEASFVPAHTGRYEVELELRHPASAATFRRFVKTTEAGALDGRWIIKSAETTAAQGGLSGYLFLSTPGPYRRRVLQLVGLDPDPGPGVTRMSRGVGRVRGVAGEKLNVELQLKSQLPDDVAVGDPHLVVRFNRRQRGEYLTRSLAVSGLATTLIGVSLLWAVWVWRSNRKRS